MHSLRHIAFGDLGVDLDPNAIGTATGGGLATGAVFGPWGALIGGAVGAGSSIATQLLGQQAPSGAGSLTGAQVGGYAAPPSGGYVPLPGVTITAGQTPINDPNVGIIPGVSNRTVLIAAGAAVALAFALKSKRSRRR